MVIFHGYVKLTRWQYNGIMVWCMGTYAMYTTCIWASGTSGTFDSIGLEDRGESVAFSPGPWERLQLLRLSYLGRGG